MKIIIIDVQAGQEITYDPPHHEHIRFGALLTFVRQNKVDFSFFLYYYDQHDFGKNSTSPTSSKIEKIIASQQDLDRAIYQYRHEGTLYVTLRPVGSVLSGGQSSVTGSRKQQSLGERSRVYTNQQSVNNMEEQDQKLQDYLQGKVSEILNRKIDKIIKQSLGNIVEKQLIRSTEKDSKFTSRAKKADHQLNFPHATNAMSSEVGSTKEHYPGSHFTTGTKNSLRISEAEKSKAQTEKGFIGEQEDMLQSKNFMVLNPSKAYQMVPRDEKHYRPAQSEAGSRKRTCSIPSRVSLHEGAITGKGNFNIVTTGHQHKNFQSSIHKQGHVDHERKKRSRSRVKIEEAYQKKGDDNIYLVVEVKQKKHKHSKSKQKGHHHCEHRSTAKSLEKKSHVSKNVEKEISKHSNHLSDSESNILGGKIPMKKKLDKNQIQMISSKFGLSQNVVVDVLSQNWYLPPTQIASKLRDTKCCLIAMEKSSSSNHNTPLITSRIPQLQPESARKQKGGNILEEDCSKDSWNQSILRSPKGQNPPVSAFGFQRGSEAINSLKYSLKDKPQSQPEEKKQFELRRARSPTIATSGKVEQKNKETSGNQGIDLKRKFQSEADQPSLNTQKSSEKHIKKNEKNINNRPPRQKTEDIELSSCLLSLTSNLLQSSGLQRENPFRRKISRLPEQRIMQEEQQHQKIQVVGKKAITSSTELDFSKELQKTEEASRQKKSIREKGKIFLKMMEIFGREHKSQIFHFIDENEHLSENHMIQKWEYEHRMAN